MHSFLQDLRHAALGLLRQPGASALVISMLAVGIAGNIAVFSLVNALLLRPLPYPEPDRLVYVNETAPRLNLDIVGIDYADFHRWRGENRMFDGMAVFETDEVNLSSRGEAERVKVGRVTHDVAPLVGLKLLHGRSFLPEEDRPGAPKVTVVGKSLWETMLHGDPSAVGSTLTIDGEPYTIIGVADFDGVGLFRARLWLPLAADPEPTSTNYRLDGIGRLKAGVSMDQARDDLMRVQKRIVEKKPDKEPVSPLILPFREPFVKDVRQAAWLLWGAVGVVFLIACANTASVVLARAAARGRELAMRRALGAGRLRIVRQLLTEGLVLSLAGGALGLLVGVWGLDLLVARLPENLPTWMSFEMDRRVAAVSVLLAVGAPFLFSLIPALQVSTGELRPSLEEGGSRDRAGATSRTLSTLVVLETALALLLLVAAGLLSKTFLSLHHVDPGFRAENALSFRLALPESKYKTEESQYAFYEDLLTRVRALPGVEASAAASHTPLAGHWLKSFTVEGARPKRPDEPEPVVLHRVATPGYFRTLGMTLAAGRDFGPREGRPGTPQVVVVNEEFRQILFKGSDPVGKRIRYSGSDNVWMTVVGVIRDLKHYGVDREMRPGVYVPMAQRSVASMSIVVRTPLPPEKVIASARDVVRAMDPDLPVYETTTLTAQLERSLETRRLYAWVFGVFAAVALALTLGGVYGVLSYAVTERSHEIGIRMALGARQAQVVGLVLGRGITLVGIGAFFGLVGSAASAHVLSGLVHGVGARDPGTYALVTLALLAVAVLASVPPAWRASAVDPMRALRRE